MKKKLLIGLSIVLVLIVAAVGFSYYELQQFRQAPLRIAPEQTVVFEVKAGSTIRQVARQLKQQHLLPTTSLIPAEWLFIVQARLEQLATKIKVGDYQFEAGMTTLEALERIVSGKTLQYQVSLIEGRTFKELQQMLQAHPRLEQTLSNADYANLMPLLGELEGSSPEGWFLPDTYNFPRGTKDIDVLKRSHAAMVEYLNQAWQQRVPHAQITTPYQALILASIVEKETGVLEERPLIARVFLSRLEKGMRLQTDPTVIYGMGENYTGNIRKRDLQTDTPYNTYTRTGLPPTPIAMPGKAAIDAVMHPAETEYLYFVATGQGDGRHFFSKTYEEHRKAVVQYQLNGNRSRYTGDQ